MLMCIFQFLRAGAWNPYQNTIISVGKILDAYDTDKTYPVYGFGAKVRFLFYYDSYYDFGWGCVTKA